ncbi:GNAT family N-acetyltransferase [Arcticibacterium luteifluviistationis]|uniref:N-acetyltransferase n=1 Tax=Arcticibacterium luteifluviistationis TaxID=1784714 RepID=A0A2Z4G6R1_9BACT|nr:GNAT family N-acetyltransferase [Arcticibacterium luteifluviistationis]AWV96831.1 N-acetyltransferase [Arcticibacterium luteifluviistationis]
MIREATKHDLVQISEIWNHYIINTSYNYDSEPKAMSFFEEFYQEKKQNGYPILVIEDEKKVVGYATYGQFRGRSGYKYSLEHGVYLYPNLQGKGYGKRLMTALIERAKKDGHHSMTAGIDTRNQGSIDFHLKFGFQEIGTFKEIGFKNGEWLDCLFLQLML